MKKHTFWCISLAFSLLWTPCNLAAAGAIKQPNIEFEETSYDFGAVRQGERVEHIFRFKNVGEANLEIGEIGKTCGCQTALMSSKVIAPGSEGKIQVILDTRGRQGKQNRTVKVQTNDPDEAVVKLQFHGYVEVDLIAPKQIYFGYVRIGQEVSKTYRVEPDAYKSVKGLLTAVSAAGKQYGAPSTPETNMLKVESTSPHLAAEIINSDRTDITKSKRESYFEIKVTLKPTTPPGRFDEKIKLHTTSEIQPVIEIAVGGEVVSPIQAFPEKLFLGIVRSGKGVSRKIIIQKLSNTHFRSPTDDTPLEITKIETSSEFIRTEATAVTEGKEYSIRVRLEPGAPKGRFIEAVKIHTNSNLRPVIEVPVQALIR